MAISSYRAFGFDVKSPEELLQLILVLVVFSVALLTGTWDLGNSRIVMYHELVFVGAFGVLLAWRIRWPSLVSRNRWPVLLLVVWVTSISVSFFTSPLNLQFLTVAQFRYAETLVHVLFFLALYASCQVTPLPLKKVLLAIVLSNAIIVVHAFLTWHLSPEPSIHTYSMWFSQFPMAGHARHAGYNMLVAALAAVGLMFASMHSFRQAMLISFGLMLVCTCLVWLGGRGAMLSAVVGAACAWYVLRPRASLFKTVAVVAVILFSVVLAEHVSQFRFNGLGNSVARSLAAEDLNRLSSSRLAIWKDSLEKLKGNWLMGLGSQAYLLLPDRLSRKTVMPHNLFVQFLLEWGVVGTLLFTALLATLYSRILRLSLLCAGGAGLWPVYSVVAIVVAMGVHGLTDGTFYHGKASFYLALAAGLCFAVFRGQNLTKTDKNCQFL